MNRSNRLSENTRVSTRTEALRFWAKLGWISFGGPAGQIAIMHKELVERRRWVSEDRFLHALNFCMLLPGPEAQQLAAYIGWKLHGIRGGIAAGVLFLLPGALIVLLLSVMYAGYQDVSFVQALFFGIKAAVLAVVVDAVIRIGRRALKNPAMIGIAVAAFVAIFFFNVAFPIVILGAGLVGLIGGKFFPENFSASPRDDRDVPALPGSPPSQWRRNVRVVAICVLLWFSPILTIGYFLGINHVYAQQGIFFSKMAVVTFGGAYAVLAYVSQQAVEHYNWLTPGEMLDGLGLAETTPGPLILVVQFVGFLGAYRNPGVLDPMLAGTLGALLTTWVTFVPCFLWVFLGAPYIEKLQGKRTLSAGMSAITAAVVGVIANLAIWFGLQVLFAEIEVRQVAGMALQIPVWRTVDVAASVLAASSLLAILRFKVSMLMTLAGCAFAGLVYKLLMS